MLVESTTEWLLQCCNWLAQLGGSCSSSEMPCHRDQPRWRCWARHDAQAGQPNRSPEVRAAGAQLRPLSHIHFQSVNDQQVLHLAAVPSSYLPRHTILFPTLRTLLPAADSPVNNQVGESSVGGPGATGLDCRGRCPLATATAAAEPPFLPTGRPLVCTGMPAFQGSCAHDHDCEAQDCSSAWSLYKHIDIQRVSGARPLPPPAAACRLRCNSCALHAAHAQRFNAAAAPRSCRCGA